MNIIKALRDTHSDKKKTLRPLTTVWGERMDRRAPLPEYPRPQLVREHWQSLNGEWQCAFTGDDGLPQSLSQKILVPFSPESALSGVGRQLQPGETLWYQRSLTFSTLPQHRRCLMHFGAVDQRAQVFVNGKKAAAHEGGYLPFSVDITLWLQVGENQLTVCVWDDSDASPAAHGKQKLARGGMFYTAQSGIWQTVWYEWVPECYIQRLVFTPQPDGVLVTCQTNAPENTPLSIAVFAGEQLIAGQTSAVILPQWRVPLAQPHLWSPEDPFLYTAVVRLGIGENADTVKTYFAMRFFTVEADDRGCPRFCLNHRPYFLNAVLDQGYWPDGLYTAPADEALVYDIQKMKEHGFNCLRKHMKLEAERWYYHCDRLGMLVWQDMPCGGRYRPVWMTALPTVLPQARSWISDVHYRLLGCPEADARRQWEHECLQAVRTLQNHPCIAIWSPFNEGWGQFDSVRITAAIRDIDSTRLIDSASGWFDCGAGDFQSRHIYFRHLRFWSQDADDKRAAVLSEYGGYAYRVAEHSSLANSYGYRHYKDRASLNAACRQLVRGQLLPMLAQGLSGAVYTQLSDVEEEVNGILTYDRRVDKLEPDVFSFLE